MRYQLVLKFPGDSLNDFDQVVRLEDELTETLGEEAEVDGHDVGSGEANIFILTSDPKATFQSARPVLERRQRLDSLRAAYRDIDGAGYTVVWPQSLADEFRVL